MVRRKQLKIVAGIAGLLLMAGNAFGFSLLEPYTGPIKFKYSNWERSTPAYDNGDGVANQVGERIDGIAKVTSIIADDANQTTLWNAGGKEELTVRFYDYVVSSVTPAPGGFGINFTGGIFNIYLDNTPDFNATYNPTPGNNGATAIAKATDGLLFLSMIGRGGSVIGDPAATLRSTVDALTNPITGKGFGLLELTGGAYAGLFGGVGARMSVNSDLNSEGVGDALPTFGWPLASEDPVRGQIVPEPGTWMLVGIGMAAIGLIRRKNSAKN